MHRTKRRCLRLQTTRLRKIGAFLHMRADGAHVSPLTAVIEIGVSCSSVLRRCAVTTMSAATLAASPPAAPAVITTDSSVATSAVQRALTRGRPSRRQQTRSGRAGRPGQTHKPPTRAVPRRWRARRVRRDAVMGRRRCKHRARLLRPSAPKGCLPVGHEQCRPTLLERADDILQTLGNAQVSQGATVCLGTLGQQRWHCVPRQSSAAKAMLAL